MTSCNMVAARAGLFIVISAASGTGKTTLVKRLLEEMPDLSLSISCTTRPKRPGEKSGVDYYFIDRSSFLEKIKQDEFFEYEEVHGSYYGTPKAPLMKNRRMGIDTLFDVDTRGALNIKKQFPDSVLIFLLPPSFETLTERLKQRHTEDERALKRRINEGKQQIAQKDKFDYNVVNDNVDRAFTELKGIILSYRNSE